MTNRSLAPILLLCAALGVACRSEDVFEPESTTAHNFTALYVSPSATELSIDESDSVKLLIVAVDRRGARLNVSATTYSSTAPAVAVVSGRGIVRPVAPGIAVITATLTLGDVTRTASMTVMVHGHYELLGVGNYQLTALFTSSDWVNLEVMKDARYTAFLMLEREKGSGYIRGVFTDWRFVSASGVEKIGSANASGTFANGQVDISITPGTFSMRGALLESGDIAGTWVSPSLWGTDRGTFTATRISQ